MRKTGLFTVLALLLSFSINGFAQKTVTPTTTLSAETGNNTSAADGFQAQRNGNSAAGNVSKVDTRTLLYPGATTGIYAHYMPWFGTASHMNVGYDTADANQSARQVNDMVSRGIQGVIVDWYGRNFAHEDQSTQSIFNEAQKHAGFKFAIMEDAGALKSGNPTGDLIADLIYAAQKYQQSPNYMRIGGRPVVFYFGVEALPIDWNAVRAQVPGNPLFIFENASSYGRTYSDGAFGWINGFTGDTVTNWGQPYLNDFYANARNSTKHTFGATWKGFNDALALWAAGRIIGQNCGQTWLNTFAEIGRHYSSSSQLESLQLVTWNDYEEGSPLEMGIDNCVSVGASVSGNTLNWTIKGNENTIHHYTVFISTDGQNLMAVTDVPAGTHSLNLGQYGFAKSAYNIYVKAVGQPSIRNQMSGVVGWTSSGGSGGTATPPSNADLKLSATPASLQVARGSSAAANVVLTPTGNFTTPVTLGCTNLPDGVTCSFDQSTVTPGSTQVTARLTVAANNGATTAGMLGSHATYAMWLPGLSFGMFVFGDRKRSRKFWVGMALMVMFVVLLITTGCGGGGKSSSSTPAPGSSNGGSQLASKPGTYQITILAQSGSFQRTTTASVTVQ